MEHKTITFYANGEPLKVNGLANIIRNFQSEMPGDAQVKTRVCVSPVQRQALLSDGAQITETPRGNYCTSCNNRWSKHWQMDVCVGLPDDVVTVLVFCFHERKAHRRSAVIHGLSLQTIPRA